MADYVYRLNPVSEALAVPYANRLPYRPRPEFDQTPVYRGGLGADYVYRLNPVSEALSTPFANRLPFHPAPGFGDLVSGFFVVPQNPLQMAREGVSRVPTLGEFMAGSFPVPQNPIRDYVMGRVRPLGQGLAGDSKCQCGGGCGVSGGCGGCGGGMGALDLSSITTLAQQDSLGMGLPNWGYAAIGIMAYMFLFGTAGGSGTSRVYRAKKAYRSYRAGTS